MKTYRLSDLKLLCNNRMKLDNYFDHIFYDVLNEALLYLYSVENWWFANQNYSLSLEYDNVSDSLITTILPEWILNISNITFNVTKDYQPSLISYLDGDRALQFEVNGLNCESVWTKETMPLMFENTADTMLKIFSGTLGTGDIGDSIDIYIDGIYGKEVVTEKITLAAGLGTGTQYYTNFNKIYKSADSTGNISVCETISATTISASDFANKKMTFTSVTNFKVGDKFVVANTTSAAGYCPLTITNINTTTKIVTVNEDITGYTDFSALDVVYRVLVVLNTTKIEYNGIKLYIYPLLSDTTLNLSCYRKPFYYSSEDETKIVDFPQEFILTVLINYILLYAGSFEKESYLYQQTLYAYQNGLKTMYKRNNINNKDTSFFKSDINFGRFSGRNNKYFVNTATKLI